MQRVDVSWIEHKWRYSEIFCGRKYQKKIFYTSFQNVILYSVQPKGFLALLTK